MHRLLTNVKSHIRKFAESPGPTLLASGIVGKSSTRRRLEGVEYR
jgi:hypothetical protein